MRVWFPTGFWGMVAGDGTVTRGRQHAGVNARATDPRPLKRASGSPVYGAWIRSLAIDRQALRVWFRSIRGRKSAPMRPLSALARITQDKYSRSSVTPESAPLVFYLS
ncbi:MAG: hypothetical protein JXA21_06435 [Anaerolineae bacterium]|nr:hypothetical protein [Anaerolineae bacterium]